MRSARCRPGSAALLSAAVLACAVFAAVLVPSESVAQTAVVEGREYRQSDGKWFRFVDGQPSYEIVPNTLLLMPRSKGGITDSQLHELGAKGTRVVECFSDGLCVVTVQESENAFGVAQTLIDSGVFDIVGFDFYGRWACLPDDPYYQYQWNLGESKLRMASAWEITTGDSTIAIAIMDSGTDYNHEDLTGNIWVNPAEDLDGDGVLFDPDDVNYEDDDNNGFIDDFIGWDFYEVHEIEGEAPPPPGDNDPMDLNGHGTAVAGIAGAVSNNSTGLAGLAGGWHNKKGCSLMILRVGDWAPRYSCVHKAFDYIIKTFDVWGDIRVVNMSFEFEADEGEGLTNVFQGWLLQCVYRDIAGIAAAGDLDRAMVYPGRLWSSIAVGATGTDDVRWEYSSTGDSPNFKLDVMAPHIVYTTDLEEYGSYTSNFGGTSASAPHVAGLAGLLCSVNPDMDYYGIRDALRHTADKVAGMGGSAYTDEYGYGRVNGYRAVVKAKYDAEIVSGTITEDTTWPTSSFYSNVYVEDDVTVASGATLTIDPGTTVYFATTGTYELEVAGSLVADAAGGSGITFRSAADNPEPADWDGIVASTSSATLMLKNCTIEHATQAVTAVTQSPCQSTLEDCTFDANLSRHIYILGDNANCDVKNCNLAGDCVTGVFTFWLSSSADVLIDGCEITGTSNATYGILVASGSPLITNNVISGFSTGAAIRAYDYSTPVVASDTLSACKWGIFCDGSSAPAIGGASNPCRVVDCTVGLYTEDTSAPVVEGDNMVIGTSSTVGVETRDSSTPSITDGTTISGCYRGLYARDSSAPYLRNTIFDNCTLYATEATSQAEPDLGAMPDAGFNSFNSSVGCGTYKHVKAKLRYPGLGPRSCQEVCKFHQAATLL